jgi:microcystin-dependent protein
VTNLVSDLAGKAATVHTHVVADTTGLQTALDGKAASVHTHVIADTTGLQTAIDGKADLVHTHTIGQIADLSTQLAAKAPIASPTFTGVPAAPTANADTNTTQVATTAFVAGQAGSATPVMNGTAAVGSSLRYARQDHVHPTDTSRAAVSHSHAISDVTGLQTALNAASPVASLVAYAGTTAPSGWLFCDGSAVSRTTYAALFAVVSTRYGVGDGSTTFNLPDLRSRFVRGAATTGSLSGSTGGSDTHTHTGTAASAGSHTHTFSATTSTSANETVNDASPTQSVATNSHTHTVSGTTGSDGAHTHTVSADSSSNVPVHLALNWIIKA